MQRIDGSTRSATLPVPAATGAGASSPGFFSRGDPLTGTPPTTLDADWANMIQEEIIAPVVAAGIAPDKADHGQLLAAMRALFAPKTTPVDPNAGVAIGGGEFSVPLAGGIILKGGTVSGTYSEGQVSHNFAAAFPNQCFIVVPVAINAGSSTTKDIWSQRVAKSAAAFTVMLQLGGGGTTNSIDGFDWIAIGN